MTRDDTRGADYKTEVDISFVDAIKGATITLEMNKRVECHTCRGSRAKPGSKPRKCYECGGRGSIIGNYGIKKRCPKCEGAGCLPKVMCPDCEGIGVQRQVLKEEIELPSGLRDGQKIKVPQLGHAADVVTSVPGDLLLTLRVGSHDFYKRKGNAIETKVDLTLSEALKGGTITISTVHGPLNVSYDAGTSTGDKKVLKHWGVPEFDPPENYDPVTLRGDHIVTFNVVLPKYSGEEG